MRFASALKTHATSSGEASRLGISFAGIQFIFEGKKELLEAMSQVPFALLASELPEARAVEGSEDERASAPIAKLTCALSGPDATGLGSSTMSSRTIEWDGGGTEGTASSRHSQVRWEPGPDGLQATASLASVSPRAAESLLMSLSAALLHQASGAVLHAASIELPAGVVAFVGPSGAGKSTACEHVVGARHFSLDRLAVAPGAAAEGSQPWVAHPLPGGTAPVNALPPSVALGRPLLAVLRVHKAAPGCELRKCSHTQAVALLRAAAFHAHRRPEAEGELLAHLERLARQVPVAELHLSLGTSLEPILSRWLSEVEQKRGEPEEAFAEQERRHVGA